MVCKKGKPSAHQSQHMVKVHTPARVEETVHTTTRHTKEIVSTAPNQFLHVDTTFFPLPDSTKAAIVFVSDNFSKHILGWARSLKHSAQNVMEALQMTIQTIRTYHPHRSFLYWSVMEEVKTTRSPYRNRYK